MGAPSGLDRDPQGRRAVFNEVRRKLERDAMAAGAADDLAAAVESVLAAAGAEPGRLGGVELAGLRAALDRFRQAAGGPPGRLAPTPRARLR